MRRTAQAACEEVGRHLSPTWGTVEQPSFGGARSETARGQRTLAAGLSADVHDLGDLVCARSDRAGDR